MICNIELVHNILSGDPDINTQH